MMPSKDIRPIRASDIEDLKAVLDETELFPSELLEDMIRPYLEVPDCADIWTTYENEGKAVAVLYCEKERITVGTWNVLALAVLPSFQSRGIGARLMANVESRLSSQKQSTLIVETSSLPEFQRTRAFYENIGYVKEAQIRDFYDVGDDKVVFWKSLVVDTTNSE